MAPVPFLAELRELVLEQGHPRMPKWKFLYASDFAIQLQPQARLFSGLALQGPSPARADRPRERGPHDRPRVCGAPPIYPGDPNPGAGDAMSPDRMQPSPRWVLWMWLSFVERPGHRHLGVAVVRGRDVQEAIQRAWDLGINRGGQVLGQPLDARVLSMVPDAWREQLLSTDDLERLEILYDRRTRKES